MGLMQRFLKINNKKLNDPIKMYEGHCLQKKNIHLKNYTKFLIIKEVKVKTINEKIFIYQISKLWLCCLDEGFKETVFRAVDGPMYWLEASFYSEFQK